MEEVLWELLGPVLARLQALLQALFQGLLSDNLGVVSSLYLGGSFTDTSDSLGSATCLLGLRAPFMLGRLLGSKLVGAFPNSAVQG